MKKSRKIALVRGASINDWELQSYVPLTKKHEITVFGSLINEYHFTLPLAVKKLVCPGNFLAYIPGGIRFLYYYYGDPQILLGLERALTGFDLVHAVERTNYYTLQAINAKRRKLVKKVVVHCWENILHFKEGNKLQQKMKNEIDKNADLFLAGTEGAKQVLLEEGISPEKISIVPFGIDTNHFILPQKRVNQDITVLFAARMTIAKGVYVLYQAAKYLVQCRKMHNLRAVFMGEGKEKKSLKKLISADGLNPWIQIMDFVPYNELRQMYWRSEMLVLPSIGDSHWQEQFGLVLTESMACGTPVIGALSGSIPEIIGDAGLLFKSGDSRELATAIVKLHQGRRLRSQLIKKARHRVVTKFSTQVVSQQLTAGYERVLA